MDYNSHESEYAAAAFAIHSMEQAELHYQKERRKSLEITRTNSLADTRTRPSSAATTRRLSSRGVNIGGGASMKMPMAQDQRDLESVFPSRYPNRGNSIRPTTSTDGNLNERGNARRHGNAVETKADAWEKSEMKMIHRIFHRNIFSLKRRKPCQ